jgi:hypothetical protein
LTRRTKAAQRRIPTVVFSGAKRRKNNNRRILVCGAARRLVTNVGMRFAFPTYACCPGRSPELARWRFRWRCLCRESRHARSFDLYTYG